MDKLLAPTKDEMKSLLKYEYRQRQEQARKDRIFNPRIRLIGIDKNALDQHVQEKQQQQFEQAKQEHCFAMEQNRQMEMCNLQINEAAAERMRMQREIDEFRNQFQRKEQTREFDLNDPNYLRYQSADSLDFLGRDPQCMHRIRLQREQQKSWLEQQIDEKIEIQIKMSEADQAIEIGALNQDAQLSKEEQLKRMQRKKQLFDTANFNLALAQAQKQKQLDEKRREYEDNLAEMMNHLSSDMLMENKEAGASSSLFGGKRINPTTYRGMTDDQLNEIRREQLQQIKQKKFQMALQKENEMLYAEVLTNNLNQLEAEDQDAQCKRTQMLTQQSSINGQLVNEQKQRNHHLNEDLYKFTPTQEFFDQFNTTTR